MGDIVCVAIGVVGAVLPLVADSNALNLDNLFMLKMLRLLKLAKLVKMMRYSIFEELKLMIYGVASGLKVLHWAHVLLFGITYFLGVVMNSWMKADYKEFQTVPQSMFTIFRCFTDGCSGLDGTPLAEGLLASYGKFFGVAYVLVHMMVMFGLFNLVMAIFLQDVTQIVKGEGSKGLGRAPNTSGSDSQRCLQT